MGCLNSFPTFQLACFYLDGNMVEPHPCQRPILSHHVNILVNEFEENGIRREENFGTVIGLGDG